MSRNKSLNDFRGFSGPDADLETSLREYGIAWKKSGASEYTIVYSVDYAENEYREAEAVRFTFAHFSYKDWTELIAEEWFQVSRFLSSIDADLANIQDRASWIYYLSSAISYHGAENIFGSDYSGGFLLGSKSHNAKVYGIKGARE